MRSGVWTPVLFTGDSRRTSTSTPRTLQQTSETHSTKNRGRTLVLPLIIFQKCWNAYLAISRLPSFRFSPSTLPFTVTWCPAWAATLSCASMAYTLWSASLTKTYFAPFSFTHFSAHAACLSFAPLAPQALSEMYPVQLPSAPKVRTAVQRVSAKPAANLTFMFIPLQKFSFVFVPVRAPFRVAQLTSTCPDSQLYASVCAQKAKREESFDPPNSLLLSRKKQTCPAGSAAYCPEVLVAAVAAPAPFGVDR